MCLASALGSHTYIKHTLHTHSPASPPPHECSHFGHKARRSRGQPAAGRAPSTAPRAQGPGKIGPCSPCLKFCAFQGSFTFQNRAIRCGDRLPEGLPSLALGACPGHPTCPGQRVTRRNTRALLCPRAQTERPRGPRSSSGAAPAPVGNTASPVTPADETPPGPLRAEIRVVTVPSERVRNREGQG